MNITEVSEDHLDGANRTSITSLKTGKVVSLSLSSGSEVFHPKGKFQHESIILCQSQKWPACIYQRVGAFIVMGGTVFQRGQKSVFREDCYDNTPGHAA